MQPLAIVIPAFKARFLEATLRSITAQTRRDFVVYVGDDASPHDLQALCAPWQQRMDLRYTRFEHNLGGRDLVAQWARCVALGNEPWVWLFADDDVMPPSGVETLLNAVAREGERFDLFHFNVERIDAEGRFVRHEPVFPPLLSVREFARLRLRFELSSFAPDYVFRRSAFEAVGGFVNFPRAWCADDASWIRLGARSGICTLPGAWVGWRDSGDNISAHNGSDADAKTQASIGFLCWLDGFLQAHPARDGEPGDRLVMNHAADWFFGQAKFTQFRFLPGHAARTVAALRRVRGLTVAGLWWRVLLSDVRLHLRQRRAARKARRT